MLKCFTVSLGAAGLEPSPYWGEMDTQQSHLYEGSVHKNWTRQQPCFQESLGSSSSAEQNQGWAPASQVGRENAIAFIPMTNTGKTLTRFLI